jgi:hypothetical protein
MARREAPQQFYAALHHLCAEVWPGVPLPVIELYFDDIGDAQGQLLTPDETGGPAIILLHEKYIFTDFVETFSTIAHEVAHLLDWLMRGETDHGPTWRRIMDEAGVPVPADSTRESIKPGGPVYWAFQSLMAKMFSCEPAPEQRSPHQQDGAMDRRAPGIIRQFGPRGRDAKRHMIVGDCSYSMTGWFCYDDDRIALSRFDGQSAAVNSVWPHIKDRSKIFGFAAQIVQVSSPDDLHEGTPCDTAGTCFVPVFERANSESIDHLHLFSDGSPCERVDQILSVWEGGTYSVSTYYIGAADDEEKFDFVTANTSGRAIALMRKLARGDGKAYVIKNFKDLKRAIQNETGVEFADAPSVKAETGTGAQRMSQQNAWSGAVNLPAEMQVVVDAATDNFRLGQHLVGVSGELTTANRRIGTLEKRDMLGTALASINQHVNRVTADTLDVLSVQRQADTLQHEQDCKVLGAALVDVGKGIAQIAHDSLGGTLLQHAQAASLVTDMGASVRLQSVSLSEDVMARARALMGGNGSQQVASALPSPSRVPSVPQQAPVSALPPPTGFQQAPARQMAALSSPTGEAASNLPSLWRD